MLVVALLTAVKTTAPPWPAVNVFPTGWFSSEGFHLDAVSSVLPQPFPLILNYNGGHNSTGELQVYMSAMAIQGLSVIMEVPRRWLVPHLELDNISALAASLGPYANSSLHGYYLADEPDNARSAIPVATLVEARATLRNYSLSVPIFGALCTNLTQQDAASWATAFDVRIYDS